MKSHGRATSCPKKTISSEAWIESFSHSPYGISPQMQTTAITSVVSVGLAYIAKNETMIGKIRENMYFLFGRLKDFKQNRDNEWLRYYDEMATVSTNQKTREKIAENNTLRDLKTHCAFSKASEIDSDTLYHDWLRSQKSDNNVGEQFFQTTGYFQNQLDHPFSTCDHTDMKYFLRHKDIFGLPYLFSQLMPSSRMWITYRTIQYLFDKTDQENKLGKFNTFFWSYAELVKRLELDLKDVIQDNRSQNDIMPEEYLRMIKQIFKFRDSVSLKQIKNMNRYNKMYDDNDEIEEKIQNITEDEFRKMFERNKKMLKTMNLQVSNNELVITAFLQLINTGPVFNSLLLAKYVPNSSSGQKNDIYSWKKIGEGNDNWVRFKNTVQEDYDTTFFTLCGGAVVTVLGLCACNALGLAVLGTVSTAAGYLGLAWKKEAETYKLLKVMILSIGWHAPTVAYITYQSLVLATIVIKLCKAVSDAEQSNLRYKSLHEKNQLELDELITLINKQQHQIWLLGRSEHYRALLGVTDNVENLFYEDNFKALTEMSEQLKDNIERHDALLREIRQYDICQISHNSQKSVILGTIAILKRNIDKLTVCQKVMSAVGVISILNDVAYTFFYTVEKMDGEWNFMAHQFGMLYNHIGSENKRPIAATYLLSPFDSVFHTVSRCVNEQFIHFFCSNSANSEYISEIYMNISSATLASVYFLAGPSSSLLQIIRFLRSKLDIYYTEGKIDNIQNTIQHNNDVNVYKAEITQNRDNVRHAIMKMETNLEYYKKSGHICNNGIHPKFIPSKILLMDSSEKNDQLLMEAEAKLSEYVNGQGMIEYGEP